MYTKVKIYAIFAPMEPIEIREFRSRIGKAIRKLREEENISAAYLAKVLGVTQPTISRIENGTTSIPAEKLCFLSKIFNRTLSYFIGEQSSISYDQEDILRAGLVFYGARHLKSKQTIDIKKHFQTYEDFLNVALSEVDDPRFAAALATTIYYQIYNNKLSISRIITKIDNEILLSNLKAIIGILSETNKNFLTYDKRIEKQLLELEEKLDSITGGSYQQNTLADITPEYVSKFIEESASHD
ncbi:MAG: helix-turn-helix transcriptional regulator [Pseudomonadota bacterium]